MPSLFSRATFDAFEDASASIPLRPLDQAFERAHIPLGDDSGEYVGARRTQFRRYVRSVNQQDSEQLNRLGDALGALIDEVATSKQDYLVKAAERDGFIFANGAFRPVTAAASLFTMMSIEDFASIDECERRLNIIANERPKEAIVEAIALVESLCRTVLASAGKPTLKKTSDLGAIVNAAGKAFDRKSDDLGPLVDVVVRLRQSASPSPRHARLAIGTALTVARFVAESSMKRDDKK